MTTPIATENKPRRLNFRPASRSRPIHPDQARRQGEIANLAFLHLGGRERALAFLNTYDTALEGRPIDIAVASQDGCWRVRRAILGMPASSENG
jgi:hypothetical protein